MLPRDSGGFGSQDGGESASGRHRGGRAVSTARTEQSSGGAGVAEAAAPLLRVTNVAKAFGPTQAVRDASFELHRGEVLALVGENGCGKSTMVKILSGVHQPDAGEIEVEGEVVGPMTTPH